MKKLLQRGVAGKGSPAHVPDGEHICRKLGDDDIAPSSDVHVSDSWFWLRVSTEVCKVWFSQPDPGPCLPHSQWDDCFTTALICSRFIVHLFRCRPSDSEGEVDYDGLAGFISRVIFAARSSPAVPAFAMMLLQRLRLRHPMSSGDLGHSLFFISYMVASKVMDDEHYSAASWAALSLGEFSIEDINRMERNMCRGLDWGLTVRGSSLCNFQGVIGQEFSQAGPYSDYITIPEVDLGAYRAAPHSFASVLDDFWDFALVSGVNKRDADTEITDTCLDSLFEARSAKLVDDLESGGDSFAEFTMLPVG